MGLFRVLNKYKAPFSITKSTLYAELEANRQCVIEEGFPSVIKTIEQLWMLEIIYQAVLNKKAIENAYHSLVSQNCDTFEHINYQEKQKMINYDIHAVLRNLKGFKYNKQMIYIPYLEDFINQRYINDFQIVTLKQHQEYLEKYPRKLTNCNTLYGVLPYISDLSSLHFLGKDDKHTYFYFEESKSVYIFNENIEVIEEVAIVDKYHDFIPSIEQVKKVITFLLQSENDEEVLRYMHQEGCISDKGYTKMNKKLGKVKV